MPKRAPTRSDHLRSAVAQEAARLMAEHGIQDYLVAKRKAAERYGVVEGAFLPKNTEIEAALASYQRLFGGERHASGLLQQRQVALQAMQLHVFSDSPETVYLQLADRRYEYEVFERKVKMAAEHWISVPSVRFELGAETIEAYVFPRDGIRQAPVSPVDGKPMRRAGMRELNELMDGVTV